MGTFTELSVFEVAIYKKETTDPVLGGAADAPANKADGQLANRTRYLKDRVDTAGLTLSAVFAGDMNTLTNSGSYFITSAASNKPGTTGQGFAWVVNNGSTLATQWYTDLGTDEIYFRRITAGPTFNAWKKIAVDAGTALDLTFIQNQVKSLINPAGEPGGVIISGCVPFNVNTGAGTLQISTGVALVGTTFVTPLAYSGNYPVYLKEDGTYTVVQPGSGNYITFDPYTSQNLVDVHRRAYTRQGSVTIEVVDSNLTKFDGTGLGKWEYKGFALMNGANGTVDMRGLFMVGRNPAVADYDTVGETGGAASVALTIAQLPSTPVSTAQHGLIRKSLAGENVTVASTDSTNAGTEPDVRTEPIDFPYSAAAGQAHENRPPYKVVVYMQRI